MQQELTDALRADIGRGAFMGWFCELLLVEKDIDHTMSHLKEWMEDRVVDTPMLIGPGKSKIVAEPFGVVLVMGSWNFPYFTTLGPLIYVIASGNCAVIKPSEMSPNCSRKMKQLVARYLDTSCYACIEGAVEVAKTLTSKPFDSIVFTGSTEKGKLVAAAASKNLIPCILELGGKSPAVVDPSADLELAAKKIVFGRYLNAGQICISPDYVLVQN
jgi:aldehyde dehydrogenase (NAD+)